MASAQAQHRRPLTLTGWLGWCIGALCAAVIKLLILGARWALKKAASRRQAVKVEAAVAKAQVAEKSPAPAFVGRDWTNYEPATVRTVQFPGIGYLLVWGFAEEGVIKSTLKLSDDELVKRMGSRSVPLAPVPWKRGVDIAYALHDLVAEAERLLRQKCGGSEVTKVAANAAPPTAVASVVSVDSVAEAPRKPRRAEPAAYAHPVRRAKAVQCTIGFLEDAGVQKRTMGDRTFDQYAVDLRDADSGVPVRLWGTDLQRALENVQARVGDLLQVDETGSRPVPSPEGESSGKPTLMRLFDVKLLDRPRR